jgi:D-3-phosphoglycerate dehydrogenase
MFKAVRLNAATYPILPQEREELTRVGAEVIAIEGRDRSEILDAGATCDALLVVSAKVPQDVIEQLTGCRVISRLGAGVDRIDVAAATRRGIVVANVPDFCVHEHAEHTMALILAWARRLVYMSEAMRHGNWTARSHPGVHRLRSQTLGLIGFGRSAQAVARRATAFGMRVCAWARSPAKYQAIAEVLTVELVDLDELLTQADYVSIHVPLCETTRHLVDASRLSRMKPTAALINTARGAIVDEEALVAALRQQRIAGAALDVFEGIDVFDVPGRPPDHPFFELENVILTPHCAGSSVESTREAHTRGARNAADVLSGRWPPHVVNPHVSPRFPLAGAPTSSPPL